MKMVLEAAVNGQAQGIVTFNLRDFVATALAEKLPVMGAAAYFAERRSRADLAAFKRILKRKGGAAPIEGDEKA
jgi:hypothetical protein